MQFTALIEYLISGIVATVWVVTLVNEFIPLPIDSIKDYKEIFVVVYFPVAYILGIYVDVVSSFLIRRTKDLFSFLNKYRFFKAIGGACAKVIKLIFGKPKKDSYERIAIILAYTPGDLAKTADAYVSRDRIARGMALNAFISAFVFLALLPCEMNKQAFTICIILFLVSIAIWRRLRRLSSRFKQVAIEKLKENG